MSVEENASDQELLTRLHVKEMEHFELQTLALAQFNGASSPSPEEVIFPGVSDPEKVALRFKLKKGQLVAIERGPALKEADLAALQSEIEMDLALEPSKVGTQVLFAGAPVTGAYRFQDAFQLLPVPPDAPRPNVVVWADQPFMLQFTYKPSRNAWLHSARGRAGARRLQLVLNLLLERGIRSIDPNSPNRWVVPLQDRTSGPLRSV